MKWWYGQRYIEHAPVVHGCREDNGKCKQATRRPDAVEEGTPDVSVPAVGGSGKGRGNDMQSTCMRITNENISDV